MTMSRKYDNVRNKERNSEEKGGQRKMAQMDLTQGNITKTLLRFAFPMICGNLFSSFTMWWIR